MTLSAPIHELKNKAKKIKRFRSIKMSEALDEVAKSEGFSSWSLLHSREAKFEPTSKEDILINLHPGDMLLIGARPGLGKTTLTLQLLLQGIRENRLCFFFSLEFTIKQLRKKLISLDQSWENSKALLELDCSDAISSEYIISKTEKSVKEGSIIAIDYLQLLDQQRKKPDLQHQIESLKKYAKNKKCILLFISQIDREFENSKERYPDLSDIRLPNPLDLRLFNKTIFVNNEKIYC